MAEGPRLSVESRECIRVNPREGYVLAQCPKPCARTCSRSSEMAPCALAILMRFAHIASSADPSQSCVARTTPGIECFRNYVWRRELGLRASCGSLLSGPHGAGAGAWRAGGG